MLVKEHYLPLERVPKSRSNQPSANVVIFTGGNIDLTIYSLGDKFVNINAFPILVNRLLFWCG